MRWRMSGEMVFLGYWWGWVGCGVVWSFYIPLVVIWSHRSKQESSSVTDEVQQVVDEHLVLIGYLDRHEKRKHDPPSPAFFFILSPALISLSNAALKSKLLVHRCNKDERSSAAEVCAESIGRPTVPRLLHKRTVEQLANRTERLNKAIAPYPR